MASGVEKNMAVAVAKAGGVEVGVVEEALTVAVVAEGAEGASQAIGEKGMRKATISAQVMRIMRKVVIARSQKNIFLQHLLLQKPK